MNLAIQLKIEQELINLCSNVTMLRVMYNFSKKDFAKIIGVGVKTLDRLEKYDVPASITLRTLTRIESAFNINPLKHEAWRNADMQ